MTHTMLVKKYLHLTQTVLPDIAHNKAGLLCSFRSSLRFAFTLPMSIENNHRLKVVLHTHFTK